MKASLRSLEITTQIGCPLMCTFCPQDKLQQAYKHPEKKMSMDTFTTVLNKLPKDVEIIFAGYTEPWANKLCNQFVKLALESGFTISVFTTLYNITLDECVELADLLEKYFVQVKRIWIHLPDTRGNMLGFRYSEEYENVLSRFKQIRNNRINEMTMDTNSRVDARLQTKTNALSWTLHTRANNLNTNLINNQLVEEPPVHKYVVECTRNKNFHDNILLPNGDVVLCCMDYGLKHIVGNLLTQSYDEILNSKEIERVKQLNNTINFTEESLCKSCNDAHCRTPWNDAEVYEMVKLVDPDSLGI
jgi:radical SAM protein with 4Fe4S-binding SPASM domain